MEALILLTLIGIAWLASSRRWRRRFVQPFAIVVFAYLIATTPFAIGLATWGLTFSLPPDDGKTVDAIVVLGRGWELRNRRVELVEELWQAKRSPKVFVSGMLDAQPIVEFLQSDRIPGSALSGESCSQTTEENALYTAAILRPQGIKTILLITDPAHMLRSVLMFRSFGFVVTPYLSPLPPQWSPRDRLVQLGREYLAFAKYALTGRFKPRPASVVEQPPAAIFEKFDSWNCRVKGA